MIAERAVVIANINPAGPIGFNPDVIATPIHIYVDVNLDDDHALNDGDVIAAFQRAAAQLGVIEDQEIVQGAPGGALRAGIGRTARNPALARRAARAVGGVAAGGNQVQIAAAGGGQPTGPELYDAITRAAEELDAQGRPRPYGLLVNYELLALLKQPRPGSTVPLIQELEGLIDSSAIAGTSALAGRPFNAGDVGAILFGLNPAALDLVHTMLPQVTFVGRAGNVTNLRVEEEIVLRDLDPLAVQPIQY
jgi:hypothetical protein